MTPSSPVFRVASTTASAAVLALTVALFPGGPAAADSTEPTPVSTTSPDQCFLVFCGSEPAGDQGPADPTRTRKPKEPESPPAPPADPVPAPPEQPAPSVVPPASDPVPPAPDVEPEESAAGPSASATAYTGSPPPTGASSGQDWNTPVTRSATASRVAAVVPADDSGRGGPVLLPIIAGVLLLGAAGASFFWWGRTRLRGGAH